MRATAHASTVVIELAVADDDRALRIIAGQNPFLIVEEFGILDGEIDAFSANAGAVRIGNAGALERDVIHRYVIGVDDEDRLALAGLVGQYDTGARAFDLYVVGFQTVQS